MSSLLANVVFSLQSKKLKLHLRTITKTWETGQMVNLLFHYIYLLNLQYNNEQSDLNQHKLGYHCLHHVLTVCHYMFPYTLLQ